MKLVWRSALLVRGARSPRICFALTLSSITYAAMAQSGEPEQSQPAPELSRLEYFEGTWSCQQPAAPAPPSGVFTWTVGRDLNQFWFLGDAEEIQSPNDEQPINSREFLGYDTASKKLVRSVVVGNGNFYNLSASNWQDGKLVWSGTIVRQGQSTPLRQEIIQNNKDKFTATYFISNALEKWTPVVDETCDRSHNSE